MTGRSRIFVLSVLVAALLMTGLAAWAAVGVTWQGEKQLMPTPVFWASTCSLNGKIYVFGGSYRDVHGTQQTTNLVQIYDTTTDTWSSGPNLPTPRYLSTAVAVGSKIYVMGGRDAVGARDANQVYDTTSNTWSSAKACPAPIRGHGAAAYNGKIYTFGGNTGDLQATVNIYDPVADSWTTGAPGAKPMGYGSAVTVGDKMYFFANDLASPIADGSDIDGNLYIYDPVANSWDPTPYPMVQAGETYGQGAVVGTKIYIFGGPVWSDTAGFETPSEICQAFDTVAKKWNQINYLPSPISISEPMTGTDGSKVYVLGGDRSSYFAEEILSMVEVYNPAADTYVQAHAPVPNYGVTGGVAGIVGGKLYAAHGVGTVVDGLVDVYDIASNTWTTGTNAAPTPTFYNQGGVNGTNLIVSGGVDSTNAVTGKTAAYDTTAGTWTALADDPTKAYWAGACTLGGKLYVFGGETGISSSKLTSDLQVLDLTANTWTKKKSLPSAVAGLTAVPLNGKIYIFGGYSKSPIGSASNFNTQTWIYDPVADSYDTSKAAPPHPMAYGAGAAYGNYIFVHGGYYWQAWTGQSAVGIVKDIQVYDTVGNAWTTIEGLFSRQNHNMVADSGKLYIFNGWDPDYTADRLCIGLITGIGPTPLSASASGNPTSGPAPLNVTFTGSASGGTAPYTYAWAFGDSATSTVQNPTHSYTANGDYTATLTVTDSASATATATVTIHVGGAAQLSVTASGNPITGNAPLAVSFTSTATGGTAPYTYAWDFKDGGTSTDQNPSHTFAAGAYDVTLTVTDSASATATAHVQITANTPSNPPVVTLMKKAGNPFRFIVTGSNLVNGIQVFIGSDTTPWSQATWKSTTKVVIKGGSALKTKVPKGTPTVFTFKNPDGETTTYTFTW